ncbi:hypothetical protein OESDEN_21260 [Oesophagostomum dentatum]|uniref:Uncharacterized protein n=1 Tax=Oesophagostomum dentatum TaxID=61180 RepID=A0A0B1S6K0_OESDE|nr:hypothetical protein OESDEN_21260 [Oesophagostomum dentatum]
MCCRYRRNVGGLSSRKSVASRSSDRQKQVEPKGVTPKIAEKQDKHPSTKDLQVTTAKSLKRPCPKSEPFIPYPEVKSPSESAKQRRQEELERDKRQKIAEGFYQERSDMDDTLAQIESLKMEATDFSTARQRRSCRRRKTESLQMATARLPDE